MAAPDHTTPAPDSTRQAELGLRDRKKVRRRDDIIAAARDLFERNGIDATTMAHIADAVGVSPPTVFNYFGSKDGILIAMIDEGLRKARDEDRRLPPPRGAELSELILAQFSRISAHTLKIGSKRVWRYAEAAVIRHPKADLSRVFKVVGTELVSAIAIFIDHYELETRAGTPCSAPYLAQILYDIWMPLFLDLITDDAQTLAEHDRKVRARLLPLLTMLLTDACIAAPLTQGPRP